MSRTIASCTLVMAAFTVFLLAGGETASGQGTQPRIRSIPYGSLIAEQIRPDDDIVEIEPFGCETVEVGRTTPQKRLRGAIAGAVHVAIVDVTSTRAELVDSGRFISTFLTGTIREVLKASPEFSLREQDPVTVVLGGGAVRIGRTIVRTIGDVRYLPPVGQYMMFMSQRFDPEGWGVSFQPLRVVEDKLWPVTVDDRALMLSGTSLSSVRDEAKRLSRRKK